MLAPSLDSGIVFNAESWPVSLMQALPSLLFTLLEQGHGISLERLQLIHVDIELAKVAGLKSASFADVHLARECDASHRFLKLFGRLAIKDGQELNVVITYAERGAKKYAKPKLENKDFVPYAKKTLRAQDVKDFLQALGQDNPFFYDAEIGRLNGFPYLFVPSPLLMFELITLAQKLMKKEARFYYFTFLAAIPLDHELSLAYAEDEEGLTLIMKAGPNEAVQLRSLANMLIAEPALNHSI